MSYDITYQLKIYFPFQFWDHIWLELASPTHAITVSKGPYGHQFCWVWKTLFSGTIFPIWLLQFSHLLLWSLRRGFWWRHFKTECFNISVYAYCSAKELCVETELLQEGVSLLMTGLGTALCLRLIWPKEVPGKVSNAVFSSTEALYIKKSDWLCVEAESIL